MFALTHTWNPYRLGNTSIISSISKYSQQKNEYFRLLTGRKINRLFVTFKITSGSPTDEMR